MKEHTRGKFARELRVFSCDVFKDRVAGGKPISLEVCHQFELAANHIDGLEKKIEALVKACEDLITALPIEIAAHVGHCSTANNHCASMVRAISGAKAALAAAKGE